MQKQTCMHRVSAEILFHKFKAITFEIYKTYTLGVDCECFRRPKSIVRGGPNDNAFFSC